MAGAWLLLAVGEGDRQHGGNDGYDDEPDAYYTWDSTVPNHEKIRVGDRIVLWDKYSAMGVSVVEAIETWEAPKLRHKCPSCGQSKFKPRKTAPPERRFRCQECAYEFPTPVSWSETVRWYRSRHDAAWQSLDGAISAPELRSLAVSPKSQLSLRQLRWDDFASRMSGAGLAAGAHLVQDWSEPVGGHRMVLTRARRGQDKFRQSLLKSLGPVCAVTGESPEVTLEAAHLYSYADIGVHHQHGGLLLRRDVHRLFDVGDVAVEPRSGEIALRPSLLRYSAYSVYEGRRLQVTLTSGQREWLRSHWAQHRSEVA